LRYNINDNNIEYFINRNHHITSNLLQNFRNWYFSSCRSIFIYTGRLLFVVISNSFIFINDTVLENKELIICLFYPTWYVCHFWCICDKTEYRLYIIRICNPDLWPLLIYMCVCARVRMCDKLSYTVYWLGQHLLK